MTQNNMGVYAGGLDVDFESENFYLEFVNNSDLNRVEIRIESGEMIDRMSLSNEEFVVLRDFFLEAAKENGLR